MIGMRRLCPKRNLNSGKWCDHYEIRIYRDQAYPRYHIETWQLNRWKKLIDLHIDWTKHKISEGENSLIIKMSKILQGELNAQDAKIFEIAQAQPNTLIT